MTYSVVTYIIPSRNATLSRWFCFVLSLFRLFKLTFLISSFVAIMMFETYNNIYWGMISPSTYFSAPPPPFLISSFDIVNNEWQTEQRKPAIDVDRHVQVSTYTRWKFLCKFAKKTVGEFFNFKVYENLFLWNIKKWLKSWKNFFIDERDDRFLIGQWGNLEGNFAWTCGDIQST